MSDEKKYAAEDPRGVITVFLSLICMLFLAVLCGITESARVQGARAQCAALTGCGLYSSLACFEKNLLEQYEILGVDGSCGSGWFGVGKLERRLEDALEKSTDCSAPFSSFWALDLWRLRLKNGEITEYALLTDHQGEAFYQQAVTYMKESFGAELLTELRTYEKEAKEAQESAREYESVKRQSDNEMRSLEQAQKAREQELAQQAMDSGEVPPASSVHNPLGEIAKLRFRNILKLVTGGRQLSDASLSAWMLPSGMVAKKGTMKLEKTQGGIGDDLLFREYLLQHFGNFRHPGDQGGLSYETEYLIAGKRSDEANLKSVANRLVALREGLNYLYCLDHPQMNAKAGSLAFALTGFLGIPAITAATKHALLLAWSYGESLLDVRDLLNGGRIPLHKSDADWCLALEDLGHLSGLLEGSGVYRTDGLSYRDYLRILLYLGSVRKQRMRALDLIETNLRAMSGTSGFKAENCVVGLRVRTSWTIRPVFWRVASVVTGIQGADTSCEYTGGLAYTP